MLRWLVGIILGKIICESSNWQHIQRLKVTILGACWQLFRWKRIAKCLYFILFTQNIKFNWFVMEIKKFMLPIWWYGLIVDDLSKPPCCTSVGRISCFCFVVAFCTLGWGEHKREAWGYLHQDNGTRWGCRPRREDQIRYEIVIICLDIRVS